MYQTQSLTKKEFLINNAELLNLALTRANTSILSEYPDDATQVTKEDLYVLLNSEAGLEDGKVDPDHRHSEGERGLFPLPNNIRDWVGDHAPVWNQPMPLDVNIDSFLLYLGQLKNKQVAVNQGFKLYRQLFRAPGINGQPTIQARLLAGVVHGYFYSGTYRGGMKPQIATLLAGYAEQQDLGSMLDGTGYVHGGTAIVSNRAENIETALGWL